MELVNGGARHPIQIFLSPNPRFRHLKGEKPSDNKIIAGMTTHF